MIIKNKLDKIKKYFILKRKYFLITGTLSIVIIPIITFVIYKYGFNESNTKIPALEEDTTLLDERIFPNLKNQSFDNDVLIINNQKVIDEKLLAKIIKQIIKQFGTSKGNIYFSTKIINSLEAYINIVWNHKNRKVEKKYKIVLE